MGSRRIHLTLAATLCALVILDTAVEAERPVLRYTIADLGTLGGTESFAYAVNDRGDVVGVSRLSGDSGLHAFLYSSGCT